MVQMSTRNKSPSPISLELKTLVSIAACFVCLGGLFVHFQQAVCDNKMLTEVADSKTKTEASLSSWEELERHMERLDPLKASRWRSFLASESKMALHETPQAAPESTEQPPVAKNFDQLDEEWARINSQQIRQWRHRFEEAAAIEDQDDHRNQATKVANEGYKNCNLRKCKLVMIDFGSNIGDSLLKLIDAYLPEFDSGRAPGMKLHHSLNTTTGGIGPTVYDYPRGNSNKWILPKWVRSMIDSYNGQRKKKGHDPVYPEDYCFYGVEGNPHFTSLLRREEIQIMNMIPRPVRHLHFLTEHVGAGIDGPTTLFLDTVNVNDNFWGSSIMKSHVDVVASGGNTGVPVMGVTLTRLLQDTVLPGGHVMIKIDIEGGEYQLLEEAINSTVLCILVKDQGVRVDMLNEPHNAKIVGSEEPGKRWAQIRGDQKIKNCGVNYGWGGRQF